MLATERTERPKSEHLETEQMIVWILALFGFGTFGFQTDAFCFAAISVQTHKTSEIRTNIAEMSKMFGFQKFLKTKAV